jgi:hypothetical protein
MEFVVPQSPEELEQEQAGRFYIHSVTDLLTGEHAVETLLNVVEAEEPGLVSQDTYDGMYSLVK